MEAPFLRCLLLLLLMMSSSSLLDEERWIGSSWACGPSDRCVCCVRPQTSVDGIAVSCGDASVVTRKSKTVETASNTGQTPGTSGARDDSFLVNSSFQYSYSNSSETIVSDASTDRIQLLDRISRNRATELRPEEEGNRPAIRENGSERGSDADNSRKPKTAPCEMEESGGVPRKNGKASNNRLGRQTMIGQRHRSLEASPLSFERRNRSKSMEPTDVDNSTEAPFDVRCESDLEIQLTMIGNDTLLSAPDCVISFKGISFVRSALLQIDNGTFESFRKFRIERFEFVESSVATIRSGAFGRFARSFDELDLSRNQINSIEINSISEHLLLRSIDVSSNRLIDAGPIVAEISRLPRLTVFNLSGNALKAISFASEFEDYEIGFLSDRQHDSRVKSNDSYDFGRQKESFAAVSNKFSNLEIIDLSANEITHLRNFSFVDLIALRELRLSHNKIGDIATNAFVSSQVHRTDEKQDDETVADRHDTRPDAQEYYISSALCTRGWPKLRSVDISHNNLSYIRPGALTGALCTVRRLVLSHNRIAQLPRYMIERLPYLEHIDLGHNRLVWLDVGSFTNPSLRSIHLEHNSLRKIISMTFLYLPAIVHIDLSHNDIAFLYKFSFYRLCSNGQRVTISLRSNRIQTDGVWKLMSTFQHLGNTTCFVRIDLGDNNVTRILGDALDFIQDRLKASDALHFRHWTQVSIELLGNPIQCDCSLTDDLRTMSAIYGRITTPNDESASSSPSPSFSSSSSSSSAERRFSNLDSWMRLNCSRVSVDDRTAIQSTTVGAYLRESPCRRRRDLCFPSCSCPVDSDEFTDTNCSHLNPSSIPFSSWDDNTSGAEDLVARVHSSAGNGRSRDAIEETKPQRRKMPALEEIRRRRRLRDDALTTVPPGLVGLTGLRCLLLLMMMLKDRLLRCNWTEGDSLEHLSNADLFHVITCNRNKTRGQTRGQPDQEQFLLEDCLLIVNASNSFGAKLFVSSGTYRFIWLSLAASLGVSLFLIFLKCLTSKRRRKMRRLREKITKRNQVKVSSTKQDETVRRQLYVFCSQADTRFVGDKIVNLITHEFAGHGVEIVFRTVQPSLKLTNRASSVDSDQFRPSSYSLRTVLIFLSKDWINAISMPDTPRTFLSDFVHSLAMPLTADWTTIFVLPETVSFGDMSEQFRRSVQRYPCLNAKDRRFFEDLLRRLKASFRFETESRLLVPSLKIITENGRQSILNDHKKY